MLRHALAFAVLVPLASAQVAHEHAEPDHGYRLWVPAAPWGAGAVASPPGSRHAFKVSRLDAGGEASFTVYVLEPSPVIDPVAAATLAAQRFQADPSCANVVREAAVLRFDYGPPATRYTLRQRYLAHHGTLYVTQCAAPLARMAAELPALAAIEASFAFVPIADPAAADRAGLHRRLAERCGEMVTWMPDWPTAAARARVEGKLVLVLVERYRGVPVGRSMARSTAFADPDVIELVGTRFVAYEWKDPSGDPFEDPAIYGLGSSTFGQGILFVRPDGAVVGECVSFVPAALYHRACEVLALEPASGSAGTSDAAACLARGELARADVLLAAPATPCEWRLRATLLRRLRRGEEALAALARAAPSAPPEPDDVATEAAGILLRLGRHIEAEARLASVTASADATPSARYLLALARAMRLGLEPIKAELAALCRDKPDSPWTHRAAAILVGAGVVSGHDPIAWPDPAVLAQASPSAPAPLEVGDLARAERGAIDYLIATQAPRGTWPLPMVSLVAPDGSAAVASAAIGGTALLSHRAQPNARSAIDRAQAYVLAAPLQPSAALFDYAIWGQIFALRFLARCQASGVGDPVRLAAGMERIVGLLRAGRQPGGGWAYVRYPGVGDNSIGFVTAAAMVALTEARAVGVPVDRELLAWGAGVLVRLRRTSGAFGYMAITGEGSDRAQAESAARGPLCALALHRADAGDVEGIRRALDLYLAHRLHVRRERGKGLCHTGPEGHASYYLLYGYAFAAEAVRVLPAADRARYTAALADDVLHLRCADGGFCDNAAMGRSYGAAQALIALAELAVKP